MSTQVPQTDDETADELPHPSEDPDIKYLHVGKRYRTRGGDVFEIVEYDPSGPCGGLVVVTWADRDGHPLHEHQHDDAGVSREVLAPYVEKYVDRGAVVTANKMFSEIRDLSIMEVDPSSYHDLYYEN